MLIRSVRGMNDLFSAELSRFQKIENELKKILHSFGYSEIQTPILEDLALFKRGVGETSDIVEKEMFVVNDGEHTYCLRPENTAAVVRALIERGGIGEDTVEKLYYLGPMFRKERPQKGRLRQFHQFGIELFGVSEPSADIEVITMMDMLLKALNLYGISLKINSLGNNEERVAYKIVLKKFLENNQEKLCDDCKRRIETNPLRVLDCKKPSCQEVMHLAPKIMDSLGDSSKAHFEHVLSGLREQGVEYTIDHQLVRGLDYYNHVVFEFVADFGLGAQNAIIAGGRYDGLFLTLGNKMDLPAIGCAGGLERIALLLEQNQIEESRPAISLVFADEEGKKLSTSLAYDLRRLGIYADFSLVQKSTKAQMRRADKLNARFVAVIGGSEITSKKMRLKDLKNKHDTELAIDSESIARFLKNS
jgi:histidyl-tRNA synthetase